MVTELSIILAPVKLRKLDDVYRDLPKIGKENVPQTLIVRCLVEIARQKILHVMNVSSLRFKIPGFSNAYVTAGITVNNKFCPLQFSDLDLKELHKGKIQLNPNKQLEVFQRLITERRLTLKDLEIADVHISVLNNIKIPNSPEYDKFDAVLVKLANIIKKQYTDKKYKLAYEPFIGSDELNFWLNLADDM